MVVTLAVSTYMLFGPARWLYKLMQLTRMNAGFKVVIFNLAVGGFTVSFVSEKWLFPRLARMIGRWKAQFAKTVKKRKEYKIILEAADG